MQRQGGQNLSTKLIFALVKPEYTSFQQKERGDPKTAPDSSSGSRLTRQEKRTLYAGR
jgi:hypothetical protein